MKSYTSKTRLNPQFTEPTVDETILFVGPRSALPTRIRLRVFEFSSVTDGCDCHATSDDSHLVSVVVLSEAQGNLGLPLSTVEEGIPAYDRHAVPSNLTGLAAVAAQYSRSFWEGFLVLQEVPAVEPAQEESSFLVRFAISPSNDSSTSNGLLQSRIMSLSETESFIASYRSTSSS